MNDEQIIKWLDENNPKTENEIYDNFPEITHDILDYHIKKIYPGLLIDRNVQNDSNNIPKQSSLRQQVISAVLENIVITNKELYKLFPDINESTIRQYKKFALDTVQNHLKENNQLHPDKNDELGNKTNSDAKNDLNQSSKLNLKLLEKKAYGGTHKQSEVLCEAAKQNKTPISNTETEQLIEKIIDTKLVNIESDLSEVKKCQKRQNITSTEKELESLIEKVLERVLTEKIQKLGMSIAGKFIENAMKNVHLSFGK